MRPVINITNNMNCINKWFFETHKQKVQTSTYFKFIKLHNFYT